VIVVSRLKFVRAIAKVHDARCLQMEHNKSLGPDGFQAEFHQHFWGLLKMI
jgi:hypothetical protein